MRHLTRSEKRYVCGYCRWVIPRPPERWRGHLVLTCSTGRSRGCGRNAVDYGRYPVATVSYWDEKLECWDEADVLAGYHRRVSEAGQVKRRVIRGLECGK